MTVTLENPVAAVEFDAPAPAPAAKSFTTRQAPWLKLGPQIDGEVNAETAAKLGGLDFDVEVVTAGFRPTSTGGYKSVSTRKAVIRTDTGDFIDFVSTDYEVVQYREAFNFMDTINPRYTAAGVMSSGRQGFIVAQLPDLSAINVEIGGVVDPHEYYVIVRTSHDRSKAIEVSLMPLRGKCMNQLALQSLTANAPQRWSIKHIGNVKDKLAEAQRVLTTAPKYAEIFASKARQLGSVTVTDDEARDVLKRVLPAKVKRDETINAIMGTYHGDETVGFVGTGWGLANAVSTYYDWGRNDGTRTDQSKFTSGLTGDTAKFFNRTATVLLNR